MQQAWSYARGQRWSHPFLLCLRTVTMVQVLRDPTPGKLKFTNFSGSLDPLASGVRCVIVPHHLDVSSTEDTPHSQFLFLTLLPLVSPAPFLRILVAYFCISCSSPFPTDPLFCLFLLSRLVIGLSPYRDSFGLFWVLIQVPENSQLSTA